MRAAIEIALKGYRASAGPHRCDDDRERARLVMLSAADRLARQPDGADLHTLTRGRHSLPREVVLGSQRERLLDAMVQVSAVDGYGAATVAAVASRAGVSRVSLREHFADPESCFVAAYDAAVARLVRRVIAAYGNGERSWRERVRAARGALLLLFAPEPALARICFVEVVVVRPWARDPYGWTTRVLAGLVEAGAASSAGTSSFPGAPQRGSCTESRW